MRDAPGSAFATADALGQVAGQSTVGPHLSRETLQQAYQATLGEAQAPPGRYAGAIEEKARTIDVDQLLTMIRRP